MQGRSATWCSSNASPLGSPSPALSCSLFSPISLLNPLLSLHRLSLYPPRPGKPVSLRRTCSRRRWRMQWGVLRARASRPPQQPPGLAGSRMLRPPRAPLAVPRCPHHPHGGRLSQPEALQQGSNQGGGEMERQGQPTSAGGRWGRDAVCSAHSPLMHPGGSTREEAGAWCLQHPRCGSSVPVADNQSSF